MARTITANSGPFILSSANPGDSPLTIAAGITLSGATYGIEADSSQAWVIVNQGTVIGTSGNAIYLGDGGTVTNRGTASLIEGGFSGVYVAGAAGTITNAGTILGSGGNVGVDLTVGGTISNNGSAALIECSYFGIYAKGGAAVVTNAGTIAGTGTKGIGIYLATGGTIIDTGTIIGAVGAAIRFGGSSTNLLALAPLYAIDGSISGGSDATNTLELMSAGSTGQLSGLGTKFSGFQAVGIDTEAAWRLSGANTIGSVSVGTSGLLDNAGTLVGAVTLAGGSLLNEAGATITSSGVSVAGVSGSAGTVVNDGTILGTVANVVYLAGGGSVTNATSASITGVMVSGAAGTVSNHGMINTTGNYGVWLYDGGSVTNGAGASISGLYNGINVDNAVGAVYNAGSIGETAGNGSAVFLALGGSVTNAANGTIAGGFDGVDLYKAGGTVTNFGTISGGTDSVTFQTPGGVLVVEAGSTLIGVAAGDGGTLELGSATGAGTLSGLGSAFTGFAQYQVVAGATWTLNSSNTIAAGDTLTSDGDLTVAGTLTNAGTLVGAVTLAGGSLLNEAGATITSSGVGVAGVSGSAGTVVNDGTILGTVANVVYLAGGGSVTNATSASITGVMVSGAAGTVSNHGMINTTGNYGVWLYDGGSVTNGAGASISGLYNGINVDNAVGAVYNAGSIGETAGNGSAVFLALGGSVTNAANGTIAGGFDGVDLYKAGGTVTNFGTISGGTDSVTFQTPGGVLVVEAGSTLIGVAAGDGGTLKLGSGTGAGTLSGLGSAFTGFAQYQVVAGATWTLNSSNTIAAGDTLTSDGDLTVAGTLTNAGMIIGNSATAVAFGGTVDSRLVLAPGYGLTGIAHASTSASDTLELAPGASVGTVSGIGSKFVNFGSIAFDTGAQWFVSGDTTGLAGTISGLAAGDTIELTGVTATGSSYSNGVLTLEEVNGSATLTLPGNFTTAGFIVTNVAAGADISLAPPCFVAGTRITTERGAMAVEKLRVGETIPAHDGNGTMGVRRVVWIGHRTVDCRRHPMARMVWPVRITANAFGPGRPHRELWLSPNHAVFVRGVLIPIRLLINGSSIAQIPVDEVTYYHVELPTHSVLSAEGLPVESYLDAGDKSDFDNSDSLIQLLPDFATRKDAGWIWETKGCAPLVLHGPKIDGVRIWLNGLAQRMARADDAAA